jgi:hypothetical protein
VDPLVLVDKAEAEGKLPKTIARKVRTRMNYLTAAVARVEKASGLRYPPYYVEPVLPIAKSGAEFGQMGVLFARVVPTTSTGKLSIFVQFTAALVAFGAKGSIEAVAAHEFTHYVDFVRRVKTGGMTSEERASTLFEAMYADAERTVPPSMIFSEKSLVTLVKRKFKEGFSDERLNKKVSEAWIEKKLPMRLVAPEENVVRVSMGSMAGTTFDPDVLRRLAQIEEKTKR